MRCRHQRTLSPAHRLHFSSPSGIYTICPFFLPHSLYLSPLLDVNDTPGPPESVPLSPCCNYPHIDLIQAWLVVGPRLPPPHAAVQTSVMTLDPVHGSLEGQRLYDAHAFTLLMKLALS